MSDIEDITYRFIEEKDLEQYILILQDFFGKNYYGAKKEFIQWQYKNSVFQRDKDNYSILAAFKNENILAIDAFLPWKFIIDGKEKSGNWDIEWLNNSKIKGLGRKLVEKVSDSADIYCGYGYNSYSENAYKKINFQLNNEIERRIAFLNEKKCLELFENNYNSSFIKENIVHKKSSKYYIHTSIKSISDNYWKSLINDKRVISYKGLDYLEWRFFSHPYIGYKIISNKQNAEDGIAVLRIEQIKNKDEKIVRIVDIMPVKGKEKLLQDAIFSYCYKMNIVFVDFYCVSYSIAKKICPEPFISIEQHKEFDIPMLFQPIEIRKRKSINFVLNNNSNIIFDFEDIYATKADSDQDIYLNTDYKTVLL